MGDRDDWAAFSAATDLPELQLDGPTLPGHGTDPEPSPSHFAHWVMWICERIALAPEPVHLIGYSMGGRLALATAVAEAYGDKVASLTLLAASPGLVEPEDRTARRAVDDDRATSLVRDGLSAFLRNWYQLPFFEPLVERMGLETLVGRREGGDPRHLAEVLRTVGTGGMPNLRPSLPLLQFPVLTIAGACDPQYMQLQQEIADGVVRGRFEAIPEVGHAVLMEAPSECARLWRAFVLGID